MHIKKALSAETCTQYYELLLVGDIGAADGIIIT